MMMYIGLETEMNALRGHANCITYLTMSLLYLVKLKIAQNSRPLTAIRFIEPIVPDFRRTSFTL